MGKNKLEKYLITNERLLIKSKHKADIWLMKQLIENEKFKMHIVSVYFCLCHTRLIHTILLISL